MCPLELIFAFNFHTFFIARRSVDVEKWIKHEAIERTQLMVTVFSAFSHFKTCAQIACSICFTSFLSYSDFFIFSFLVIFFTYFLSTTTNSIKNRKNMLEKLHGIEYGISTHIYGNELICSGINETIGPDCRIALCARSRCDVNWFILINQQKNWYKNKLRIFSSCFVDVIKLNDNGALHISSAFDENNVNEWRNMAIIFGLT